MTNRINDVSQSRRGFMRSVAAAGAGIATGGWLLKSAFAADAEMARHGPAIITSDRARPKMPYGVMSGDVGGRSAVIWSRADRPAQMIVDYNAGPGFGGWRRVEGPAALAGTDFTARVDLAGLPPGSEIDYRVRFKSLDAPRAISKAVRGSFVTPSAHRRTVTFAFSGDEAGQGWGINPEWGGYRLYESMRRMRPDFFIHSGDQIYADGPLSPEVTLDDGTVWKNIVVPAKSKVAETLDEFRGNFAYNLMDSHKRAFAAEVPFLVQWDDHETRNNWYPGEVIGIPAYSIEKNASILAARARQAMFEYNPFRINAVDPDRIYRSFNHGPLLDVFMIDERSYRGPNTANLQASPSADTAFLGSAQLEWLKQSLLASTATWKVIASDMPLSLIVRDGNPDVPLGTFEAFANAEDGAPKGRELEVAELLGFIKTNDIKNVVWVTADVHYAAAHYYEPASAPFADFKPFWEFVAGPINAGTFGPNATDLTFGPQVKFVSIPPGTPANRPPSAGLQFFGFARIDRHSEVMTVSLHDLTGKTLYSVDLNPEI